MNNNYYQIPIYNFSVRLIYTSKFGQIEKRCKALKYK